MKISVCDICGKQMKESGTPPKWYKVRAKQFDNVPNEYKIQNESRRDCSKLKDMVIEQVKQIDMDAVSYTHLTLPTIIAV